jgi:hypothetical protein
MMVRLLSVVVVVVAAVFSTVDAMSTYPQRIPNGANVPGIKALGHADGTGDLIALNKFGSAFDAAGLKWTVELCKADSDGDGQTNGQELGDPCCEWKAGATPKFSNGVSHPGDASSKVRTVVLSSNACAPKNRASSEAVLPSVNFASNLTLV